MLSTFTFRNPRVVALALLVMVSAGLSALLALGRQEDPTLTNRNASITTALPGSDPGLVEALISKPLEDRLREIAEVETVESVSANGVSMVQVELADSVRREEVDTVWTELRRAVDEVAASFPVGTLAPDVETDAAGAYAAIVALIATRDDVPGGILGRHARALADLLRDVPGARRVTLFGEPEEEVLVSLDPAVAAALGVTAEDVSAAIASADARDQAGRLWSTAFETTIDVAGDIEALDRLQSVILLENSEGGMTRLGDIATITRGPRTPVASFALSDGRPAILVAAQIEDGLQIDGWMKMVREDLAGFDAALPIGLTAQLVFDQSEYTSQRLTEVAGSLGIGMAIVLGVLVVTLGLRAALVVAAALPLVSLATVATMNLIDLPIHQMSVTGLIVALGLVVDAAIVMNDEIRKALAAGVARLEAVSSSVRRLAMPLFASTATTVFSFLPMALLPGGVGEFVGPIAVAVILMLIWSFVIALTIAPAVSGWVLPSQGRRGAFGAGGGAGALGKAFHASIRWSVRNPLRSIMLSLVPSLVGFASMGVLPPQFFPSVERDQFHIEVELAPGASIDSTRGTVLEMDEMLRNMKGVRQVAWLIGKTAPAFYYNIVPNRDLDASYAHALIRTDSPEATDLLIGQAQARLDATFPQARVLTRELVQGPPVDAPVEIRLVGPDLAVLREKGEEVRRVLLAMPETTAVRTDLQGGAPKVVIDVNEAAAKAVGLPIGVVSRQLHAGLEGVTGGVMLEGVEQMPIRVRFGGGLRDDVARLETLPLVRPATGSAGASREVPLTAVAQLSLEPSASEISRRDGERVNTVQAFLSPGLLAEPVQARASALLAEAGFVLPAGYRLEMGGDAEERGSAVNSLLASLGLIVTLSIAVVVLSLNSFRLAGITFVVAGLAAGLSFLSLAVMGFPFGITALIGVIGSLGVSVNAALVVLSALRETPAASAGDREAIAEVVMGASRHIVSTTVTTFGGFLPLILAPGLFWPPFAVAVAGGVLLSAIISFYFTPPMYVLFRPRQRMLSAGAGTDARTDEARPSASRGFSPAGARGVDRLLRTAQTVTVPDGRPPASPSRAA